MEKNKKFFFEKRLHLVVLKDSEYEWDESNLYSSQRNQSYILLSANLATWVFLVKSDRQ